VSAAEPALGLERDSFVTAYRKNREEAVQLTLEASLLSTPVIELAAKGFEGTATELLARLNDLVSEEIRKQREWPKRANILSGRLRRLAPALRRIEVYVEFDRKSESRKLRISTEPGNSVIGVIHRHQPPARTQTMTLDDDDDDDLRPGTNGSPGEPEYLDWLAEELRSGRLTEQQGEDLLEEHKRVLIGDERSEDDDAEDEIERLAALARDLQLERHEG
jgi:hypothetical protein